ncbi:mitochondrial fission factor homolog A isoform X2 [Electrophorus electricus]|uniref:mitochondrial fission factor homolog A isoform X2 n=1 Tax=Electrophorus electricus TaxID=8005 RepID=UPI0015CF9FFF|nr:mitochondrial fission factor homolog A isoform X2 [Electrophorus electricus]
MAALVYLGERSQMYGRDSNFTEVINQRMRVPERLRVGHGILPDELNQTSEDPPTVYSMHVPDRLALTDAPDLSPQPLFSKQSITGHDLSSWDLQIVQHGAWHREVQSPLRRSYSDQAFGKTPPRTPTQPRQAVHSSSLRSVGRASTAHSDTPLATPLGFPAVPQSLLSPQSVLQVARQLGQQASQRILHTVSQKYSSRFSSPDSPPRQPAEVHSDRAQKSAMQESCLGPEGEAGTAVEFIVLRRQVVKMSRRIVALERHNAERRQTELVLFSLLVSACLFNGWLWIRR